MRSLVSALALSVAALPALSADLDDLSDADRAALRSEIRSYLIDNPEVLLEAMAVLEQREAAAQAIADEQLVATNAAALFETEDDWTGGNPDGDVTVVEFIDYRCGYCKRAHPEIQELIESDGNLKLIRKELPILGAQSVLAARFAVATKTLAGPEAYQSVSDALIALRGEVSQDTLNRMANTFGLDADAIEAEMDSEETTRLISEARLLAQRLGIQGTPAFVVGDQLLRGYLPLAQMRAVVADQRDSDEG